MSNAHKKISLKQFFDSKDELSIHCDSEWKAKQLLRAFHKMGKHWRNGKSYLDESCWEVYKEETCYSNIGLFCALDWFKWCNSTIYEFEDVILPEDDTEEDNALNNDNVKKVLDILGVKPYERFEIKTKYGESLGSHYINKHLMVVNEDNKIIAERLAFVLNGKYEIVKISKLPQNKKLRNLTYDEFNKWVHVNCLKKHCKDCLFNNVRCNIGNESCWVNHKELYSDLFLNQEIEVPEEWTK